MNKSFNIIAKDWTQTPMPVEQSPNGNKPKPKVA